MPAARALGKLIENNRSGDQQAPPHPRHHSYHYLFKLSYFAAPQALGKLIKESKDDAYGLVALGNVYLAEVPTDRKKPGAPEVAAIKLAKVLILIYFIVIEFGDVDWFSRDRTIGSASLLSPLGCVVTKCSLIPSLLPCYPYDIARPCPRGKEKLFDQVYGCHGVLLSPLPSTSFRSSEVLAPILIVTFLSMRHRARPGARPRRPTSG